MTRQTDRPELTALYREALAAPETAPADAGRVLARVRWALAALVAWPVLEGLANLAALIVGAL